MFQVQVDIPNRIEVPISYRICRSPVSETAGLAHLDTGELHERLERYQGAEDDPEILSQSFE
jgi:hypothetical protein